MKINTNPVRGTYDYAPREAELRNQVKEKILRCYQKYGFSLINTPILENLELLNGSDGGDNLRLMFKTVKRGDKLDLTKPNLTENDITEEGLRYDLTVPLVRFYANNKEQLPNPFKSIQIDYSFRAERPQRGRDRQFIQCDIDEFGDAGVEAEIDVLSTGLSAYKELGFDNLTVKVNSRQILNSIVLSAGYEEKDIQTVCVSLDKLDKIGFDGVKDELVEKGGNVAVIDKLVSLLQNASKNSIDSLAGCVNGEDIERVKTIVEAINTLFKSQGVNSKCVFDISIVRGQGYYTGAIYEVYTDGFGGAIGAGGRYDKMVGKMIGVDVPAVGFSIGFSPVCMLLEERGINFNKAKKIALIYDDGDFNKALITREKLVEKYDVSLYKRPKNFKALLEKLKFANFDAFATLQDAENIEIKDL